MVDAARFLWSGRRGAYRLPIGRYLDNEATEGRQIRHTWRASALTHSD